MEQHEFRALVEEALAHLYEPTYLQTHALAWPLVSEPTGEARGLALQRLLLAAIREMKPSTDVPYESLAWRKYRYLYLRYVETISTPEIAEDLAISLRQSSRYWHEGLEAMTSILWDRYQARSASAAQEMVSSSDSSHSHRMGSLLEQEVARMDAGAGTGYARLAEVVSGALETIEPLARSHHRDLTAPAMERLPLVAVDRTVLRQAVLSLLSLAIETTTPDARSNAISLSAVNCRGTIEVALGFGSRGAAGGNAMGPSDPSLELVSRDPRWRIACRLLEPHGAVLQLRADDDGEATMVLKLPIVQPASVLVVDDNPDAIALFRRYLTGTPYRVLAATNGQEANTMADAERPSVITLDVMMPAQDGWEILRTLKSRLETQDIPVIVCSVVQELELALLLGAAGLLVKPVTRQRLLAALSATLQMGHPGEPSGS